MDNRLPSIIKEVSAEIRHQCADKRRRGSSVNVLLKHLLAIVLGALSLSFMLGVEPSEAFEELRVYRGVLVLEGKIVPGDYDKLRNFLGTKSNFDKITGGVFLASPGGYIDEAMKIGRLIRTLRLSTDAPSGPPSGIAKFGESLIHANDLVNAKANYLCTSACFFVYVSGIYRNLNWVGRLGVHRPTQIESVARTQSDEEASRSTWFTHETVKNYLKEMDVPDKYIDLVFTVPPNEIRLITQDEFDLDLRGFIPEMKDWVGAKCDADAERIISDNLKTRSPPLENAPTFEKEKMFSVSAKQSSEIAKCWMQVKAELPIEAWHKVFFGKWP